MFCDKYIDSLSCYKGAAYIERRNMSISVGIVFLLCVVTAFIYLEEIALFFGSTADFIGLKKAAKDLERYWFSGYIIWILAPFAIGIFVLLAVLPYWIVCAIGEILGDIINRYIRKQKSK
jgi:hypothetical protein